MSAPMRKHDVTIVGTVLDISVRARVFYYIIVLETDSNANFLKFKWIELSLLCGSFTNNSVTCRRTGLSLSDHQCKNCFSKLPTKLIAVYQKQRNIETRKINGNKGRSAGFARVYADKMAEHRQELTDFDQAIGGLAIMALT